MIEYFIDELSNGGKISHGSTFNGIEAGRIAADLQLKRGNPVTVTPILVSSNQIEDDSPDYFQNFPLTAEELFRQSEGNDGDYDILPSDLKRIYESCAETGNIMLARILQFTGNSEGAKS